MTSPKSYEMEEALERARAAVADGELPEEHLEELELHAPPRRQHPEPIELDPATEATLREQLGPRPAD